MASENPDHQAIARLGERQHRERMESFGRDIGRTRARSSHQPERDANDNDRLGWARRDYFGEEYDKVIETASRVLRSPDASRTQTAEALRLRAAARARKGLIDGAITDAGDALALDPEGSGLVTASDLRIMVSGWERRRPLIGP